MVAVAVAHDVVDDDAVLEHAVAVVVVAVPQEEGWGTSLVHATRVEVTKSEMVAEWESETLGEEYPVSDLLWLPPLLKLLGARLRTGVKWESCCRTNDPGIASETEIVE